MNKKYTVIPLLLLISLSIGACGNRYYQPPSKITLPPEEVALTQVLLKERVSKADMNRCFVMTGRPQVSFADKSHRFYQLIENNNPTNCTFGYATTSKSSSNGRSFTHKPDFRTNRCFIRVLNCLRPDGPRSK